MPCCGIFSAGSGSGGLAGGWEVGDPVSDSCFTPGHLDQKIGCVTAALVDEIEGNSERFKMPLPGEALVRPMQAYQAGVEFDPGIFAAGSRCCIRPAEITRVSRHEAPVVAENDRRELAVFSMQKTKVTNMTGLIATLSREQWQLDA